MVVVVSGFIGGCTPVPVQVEGKIDVNLVPVKNDEKKNTVASIKPDVAQFDYISTLTLSTGPCPERDATSYGLLLKSRTKSEKGQITCYYN